LKERITALLRSGKDCLRAELLGKENRGRQLCAAFLLLAPLGIVLGCQCIQLQSGTKAALWIVEHVQSAGVTWLLLLLAMTVVWGLTRLVSLSFLLTAAVPIALTLISYYKSVINGEPLMLSDFSLAGDFFQVADYAIDRISLSFATWLGLLTAAMILALSVALDLRVKKLKWKRSAACAALAAVLLALMLGVLNGSYFAAQQERYAMQADRDRACGVPLSLLSTWFASKAEGSAEYSEESMEQLRQEMEQSLPADTPAVEKPHIIFVMNESFFDVTRLPGVTFSDDPLPNYHALQESTDYGRFFSITCGGGTGWVEMEAFTGVARELLSADRANTDLTAEEYEKLPSYVRALQENGYETIAFHAHTNELYNRHLNYPHIGFDQVLFYETYMEQGTYTGGYFDDQSSADVIISLFEEYRENPVYLYTMTMQNHQPYYAGRYESDYVSVESELLSEKNAAALQCYVNGAYDADRMLGRLVEYFSDVEEPVMLIFAGDHLPSLSAGEEESVYSALGYVDSPVTADWSREEYMEMLTTDYLIWTNYGEGTGEKAASCTMIGAEILYRAGIGDPYFSWLYGKAQDTLLFRMGSVWVTPAGELSDGNAWERAFRRKNGDWIYDLLYGEQYAQSALDTALDTE